MRHFYKNMVVHVRRLIWDIKNSRHISKHAISPDEVEEVCHSDPLVIKEKKGRVGVIGETEDGRTLKVILQSKGENVYYPVTAYEPDNRELALYRRLKGGEKNDT